jgi:cytidyltransferase-like protein
MKPKAVIISGYFNPLHKGHVDLFKNAKLKGDKLFVIVNNDHQRALKGSKEFMLEQERIIILNNIKMIDKVFLSIDLDTTVRVTLEKINQDFGEKFELYFANGGDQNNNSIPEHKICKKLGIGLLDGLGNKIQSSSWLLKK